MKIFYNSKIAKLITFMKDFKTIMLFGAIFTEDKYLGKTTIYHEKTHTEQYSNMFNLGLVVAIMSLFTLFAFDVVSWYLFLLTLIPILFYYVWYLIEFLIRFIIYKDSYKAYKRIAFEQEAYDLQYEYSTSCEKRRTTSLFSFFKYYK